MMLEASLYEESFYDFVQAAFKVIEPETTYVDNWHIRHICEHMEAVSRGEAVSFDLLRDCLTEGRIERSYRDVAQQLAISESAVKSRVRRMRQRYGRLLREEIAETLDNPADTDDEFRHLLAVLRDDSSQ